MLKAKCKVGTKNLHGYGYFRMMVLTALFYFLFHIIHPFYVSTTDVVWSEDSKTLQITTKVFTDDLELGIKEEFEVVVDLAGEENTKYKEVGNYYGNHFKLMNAKKAIPLQVIGYERIEDMIYIYAESQALETAPENNLQVLNTLLISTYSNQQNVIHFTKGESFYTYLLNKQNISVKIGS